MKTAITSLVVAAVVATSLPAWAGDPAPVAPVAPAVAAVVTPVQKGQVTPYGGVLFSPGAIAQIVAQRDASQQAALLALQQQAADAAAQEKFDLDSAATTCTADKGILSAQLVDAQKQNSILQAQLKSSTSGPGAGVWIGIGVVGGVLLTVGTVFVVGLATK